MIFFYFLKIIFDISTSKRFKTYKPYSILAKKKKFKFFGNAAAAAFPNGKGYYSRSIGVEITTLSHHLFLVSFHL